MKMFYFKSKDDDIGKKAYIYSLINQNNVSPSKRAVLTMCELFTQLLLSFFVIYHTALFTSSMITKEFLARITHGHGVAAAALSMCLVLLLFTGSFTAISIRFSTTFAYSTSATTNSSTMDKEIPA